MVAAVDLVAKPADEERESYDEGFFFVTEGGVRFSSGRGSAPGSSQTVAVAEEYGIVVYTDQNGTVVVYVCRKRSDRMPMSQYLSVHCSCIPQMYTWHAQVTSSTMCARTWPGWRPQHVVTAQPADHCMQLHANDLWAVSRRNNPILPSAACIATLSIDGVTEVSLSADQLVVSCTSGSAISFFGLAGLTKEKRVKSSPEPIAAITFEEPVISFKWCPSQADDDVQTYLALLGTRELQHGSLQGGHAAVQTGVEAASWSPDGRMYAFSQGSVITVTAPDWDDVACTVNVAIQDGAAPCASCGLTCPCRC